MGERESIKLILVSTLSSISHSPTEIQRYLVRGLLSLPNIGQVINYHRALLLFSRLTPILSESITLLESYISRKSVTFHLSIVTVSSSFNPVWDILVAAPFLKECDVTDPSCHPTCSPKSFESVLRVVSVLLPLMGSRWWYVVEGITGLPPSTS